MRTPQAVMAAFAALVVLSCGAASGDERPMIGPAIGAAVPAVEGRDQAGVLRNRAALQGERGLVLVFTRSADWCPYCQAQLIALEEARPQIEARGWRLAAITTDTVDELAAFAQRRGIDYPLISDEDSSVIRAFDIVDPQYPPGHRAHGVPTPTIFFVTPNAQVAAKLGNADYRVRPSTDQILAELDSLAR